MHVSLLTQNLQGLSQMAKYHSVETGRMDNSMQDVCFRIRRSGRDMFFLRRQSPIRLPSKRPSTSSDEMPPKDERWRWCWTCARNSGDGWMHRMSLSLVHTTRAHGNKSWLLVDFHSMTDIAFLRHSHSNYNFVFFTNDREQVFASTYRNCKKKAARVDIPLAPTESSVDCSYCQHSKLNIFLSLPVIVLQRQD